MLGVARHERLGLGERLDQRDRAGRQLAQGADHLRMAGMADQHDLAAAPMMDFGLAMHLGDQRTGGVEREEVAAAGLRRHRFRHAMGGEDHRRVGVGDLVEFLDEDRALGAQALDHVAVVHDLVADIDRRPVSASARSTESMARTTPAQKPRGEHSSTRSGGLPGAAIGSIGMSMLDDMGFATGRCCLSSACPAIATSAGSDAYIPGYIPVIPDDKRLRPEGRAERRRRFAMQEAPLMPKATAVWLVENTALSFDQIAEFCKLHPLEVKAIADGDAAQGIKGLDPIQTGQLTRDEIDKAEADPNYRLQLLDAQGPAARAQAQEGPALHPGVAPPGSPERHPVADPQSSRAEGRPDHAAGRHHQVDHPGHPRAHPLERREPDAARSGDARPVLADRSRLRGAARRQGKAGAGRDAA